MMPQIQPPRHRVNHERWLVSYADFITLLFAFFVVLYAFAKADQKHQAEVSQAIQNAFKSMSVMSNAKKPTTPESARQAAELEAAMKQEIMSPGKVRDDLEQIRRELEKTLSNEIQHNSVSLEMTREGLVISLREAGFFESGSAIPKPATIPTLREIANKLGTSPYDMRIEGHTDNVPIHTAAYESNWELSSARATHIARIFLDLNAITPERLSAAGFAEYHPLVSNDTPEGRAKNRRVDLVILPRTVTNLAEPQFASPTGAWQKITDDSKPAAAPAH